MLAQCLKLIGLLTAEYTLIDEQDILVNNNNSTQLRSYTFFPIGHTKEWETKIIFISCIQKSVDNMLILLMLHGHTLC